MKRNQIATIAAVVAFLGIVVFINRHEPARVSEEQAKAAAEAKKLLEETEGKPTSFREEIRSRAKEIAQKAKEMRMASAGSQAAGAAGLAVGAASPYRVEFECSNGTFVVEVHPEWAPLGAEQFRRIIEAGVYNEARFFRALPNFVVQWGIPGDPEQAAIWEARVIEDDPVVQSNQRGTISYATSGPNSRTTQVFINLNDANVKLDGLRFAPFGRVVQGMEVVDAIFNGYAEDSNEQEEIERRGNAYLKEYFPKLDYIKQAKILGDVVTPSADGAAATQKAGPIAPEPAGAAQN